jgi:integrase
MARRHAEELAGLHHPFDPVTHRRLRPAAEDQSDVFDLAPALARRGANMLAARARAISEHAATVRGVADERLHWLEHIRGAKPSTVRDYRCLLREPGMAFKRGAQKARGLIMAAFGDRPAAEVTTAEVNRFLRSLDEAGFSARNVNKYRQVLQALFNYAGRDDSLGLLINPVTRTDKRREPPLAALDYYEVEELEALARVCASGVYRKTTVSEEEAAARARRGPPGRRCVPDPLLHRRPRRRTCHSPLADVDLVGRSLLVRRTISAGVETEPKGRRSRYVPLADPALAAFARLGSRDDFVDGDDYVVCDRWGRRIDESALRRRYKLACEAAGLRPVKLHGLRHAGW